VPNLKKLLFFFACCTAVAVVLGLLCSTFLVLRSGDTGYLYNDNLGILFDRQAVYFGMYVNFAIAVFVYFLQQNYVTRPVQKNAIVFALILMTVFNYLLASRISMLVLGLFWAGYIAYTVIRQKRYLSGFIMLFGAMILIVLAIQLFPKTMNRFQSVTNAGYDYTNLHEFDHFNGEISKENWNSLNTRLAIWHCGKEVLRRNWLFGVGIGDAGDQMIEEYRKNNFYFGVKYNLNAHNQYLDAGIGYGLTGFLVFLFGILVLPLYVAWRERNFLLAYFMISLAIYLSTEVMFNRNQGVTFLAFFMVLLGHLNERKETKN
jgi:O-antigen ligase